MQKVISFSLWGNNPKYTIGAIKNAILAPFVYPGWKCRYYCGNCVPKQIIKELETFEHVELMFPEESKWFSHLIFGIKCDGKKKQWRHLPMGDDSVDVMISRDTDSRLTQREKDAVDQWIQSDKCFHVMRDHPLHKTKILGGTFGCKSGAVKNIDQLIVQYNMQNADFWSDQPFLRDMVWPQIEASHLSHDSFNLIEDNPFPTQRTKPEFVGQIFDENDQTSLEHIALLQLSKNR